MDVIGRFCKIYTDICQISPEDLEHIYADDILFIDPITTHHGIDEVKRYFSNLLTQAESCKFDIADIFTCSPNGRRASIKSFKGYPYRKLDDDPYAER